MASSAWRRSGLPLNNPDALKFYREGMNLLRRGGRQDVLDAASAFREATELEPNFVLAYAKWAEALLSVYRHNAISGFEFRPDGHIVDDGVRSLDGAAAAGANQRDEDPDRSHADVDSELKRRLPLKRAVV